MEVKEFLTSAKLIDPSIESKTMIHRAGCHCGGVEILVKASSDITAWRCNCSMCIKKGFLHLPTKRQDLQLLTDENNLSEYSFGTHTAKHLFCKLCGIGPFYIPRSDPKGYSVNINCFKTSIKSITIKEFDGANYEASLGGYHPPTEEELDTTGMPKYGVNEIKL